MLLIAGLAGWAPALQFAAALGILQMVYFRVRAGRLSAFPVQVRLAYTAILLLALWKPLNWLFWIPAVGTPLQVLFGYCLLARRLSLLPWNRRQPVTWVLVWRAFTAPRQRGDVLQGQPAGS